MSKLEKITIIFCLLVLGWLAGHIHSYYQRNYKPDYTIDLRQAEVQIKHGLLDGHYFCLGNDEYKSSICITPWKDKKSGVLRVE